MSLTKYTYSIQNDTPNHKVATDSLTVEIQKSVITVALDCINTSGDVLDIWFKDSLSLDEQSDLTTVVNNHSGESLPQNIPQDVNIKTVALTTLPMQEKGFPDFTGFPYFADSAYGTVSAGQIGRFYLSYSSKVRIQGGGFHIGTTAHHGDYVTMEMTYGVGGPVVGVFVQKQYAWPGRSWEKILPDSKEIPVGICLRLSYYSVGDEDVEVVCWYDLRRTPA